MRLARAAGPLARRKITVRSRQKLSLEETDCLLPFRPASCRPGQASCLCHPGRADATVKYPGWTTGRRKQDEFSRSAVIVADTPQAWRVSLKQVAIAMLLVGCPVL